MTTKGTSGTNMEETIIEIFRKVQFNAACHQKYVQILQNIYRKSEFDNFCPSFLNCLKTVLLMHNDSLGSYTDRVVDFISKFVAAIVGQNDANDSQSDSQSESEPSCPFLNAVVTHILEFHDITHVPARLTACQMIRSILENVGSVSIDNEICDAMQEAMLERLYDQKVAVRIRAVRALQRLQDPRNSECPVMKAYLASFFDSSPLVRKELIKRIAPTVSALEKIKNRIRDVDRNVRLEAILRCADINPKYYKIIDRRDIIKHGFFEPDPIIKKAFIVNLLPKWLTCFDGCLIKLLNGLRLDADEKDVVETINIGKQVLEVFFKTLPFEEVLKNLKLNEEKLLDENDINLQIAIYWNSLVKYLRQFEETEEHLNRVLPELTPFCHFIEKVVVAARAKKQIEEWETVVFQHITLLLLDIADGYDLSDEVGRKTFYSLLMNMIQKYRFRSKVINKIMLIAIKLIKAPETLITEVCLAISEIREPLVAKELSPEEQREKDFKIAQLKVKLNILEENKTEAIEATDYAKTAMIQAELVEVKKQIEACQKRPEGGEKVKEVRDDPETLCVCLDILAGLLKLKEVNRMTPELMSCKDEFILPLLSGDHPDITWRVVECLALFAFMDRKTAEDFAESFWIPVTLYRMDPNVDKQLVIVSIGAVTDLVRMYGTKIFGGQDQEASSARRLYSIDDISDGKSLKVDINLLIDLLLEMLDSENEEIQERAGIAIWKMVHDGFFVNSQLICRVILRWYSPINDVAGRSSSAPKRKPDNEKQTIVQQRLGFLIEHFSKTVAGKEGIAQAVVPILNTIAEAPKTSPLADIDVDNLFRLLTAITNTAGTADIVHIHTIIAQNLVTKLVQKPDAITTPYFAKMLLYLDLPPNASAFKEMVQQIELILESVKHKKSKHNLEKFVGKVRALLEQDKGEASNVDEEGNRTEETSKDNEEASKENEETSKDNEVSKEKETSKPNENEEACRTILNPIQEEPEPLEEDNSKQKEPDEVITKPPDDRSSLKRALSSKSIPQAKRSFEERGCSENAELDNILINENNPLTNPNPKPIFIKLLSVKIVKEDLVKRKLAEAASPNNKKKMRIEDKNDSLNEDSVGMFESTSLLNNASSIIDSRRMSESIMKSSNFDLNISTRSRSRRSLQVPLFSEKDRLQSNKVTSSAEKGKSSRKSIRNVNKNGEIDKNLNISSSSILRSDTDTSDSDTVRNRIIRSSLRLSKAPQPLNNKSNKKSIESSFTSNSTGSKNKENEKESSTDSETRSERRSTRLRLSIELNDSLSSKDNKKTENLEKGKKTESKSKIENKKIEPKPVQVQEVRKSSRKRIKKRRDDYFT